MSQWDAWRHQIVAREEWHNTALDNLWLLIVGHDIAEVRSSLEAWTRYNSPIMIGVYQPMRPTIVLGGMKWPN